MNLSGQLQKGPWLTTVHLAFRPQVPVQGSTHFWLIHAWFWEHSELTVHSGRQKGGLPIYVGEQEHTAWSLIRRHWLLGPQGDGTQGSIGSAATAAKKRIKNLDDTFNGGLFYSCCSGLLGVGTTLQRTKGSPVNPGRQVQIGKWLTVRQSAFDPQVPGQGSLHLFPMQALSWEQSVFNTHSGLHPS